MIGTEEEDEFYMRMKEASQEIWSRYGAPSGKMIEHIALHRSRQPIMRSKTDGKQDKRDTHCYMTTIRGMHEFDRFVE